MEMKLLLVSIAATYIEMLIVGFTNSKDIEAYNLLFYTSILPAILFVFTMIIFAVVLVACTQ